MTLEPKQARADKRLLRSRRLHDYFFPHARNEYRPHIFSPWSLGVIAIGLVALQVAYFAQTRIVFKETNFLAAVLPGVLTSLTNEDRADNSLPSVTHDPALARAAQLAVNDMAEKGYFAHNSPDGKTPWHWLREAGYPYSYAGQNLAVNFTDSVDVEKGWMNSPTHRANIMKREYTRVGIAVAQGTYKGKETTFVVQYFATPPGSAPVAAASTPIPAPSPAPEPAPSTNPEPEAPAAPETPSDPGTPANDAQVAGEQLVAPGDETMPVSRPERLTTGEETMPVSRPERLDTENASTTPAGVSGTESPASPRIVAGVEEPATMLARIATSPRSSLVMLLTGLLAAAIVLLGIAIGTHLRHQYVEVAGGGLILLIFILGLVLYQITLEGHVEVPLGSVSYMEASTGAE
ncbi:MAG TPA: CAP domain-containing protein [Candidatus Paceibacterota bacterium]